MILNTERYGSGEKIIFIHGSGLNTRMWEKQRRYLEKYMEVVLIDLPGHGKSQGNGCNSVEEYRDAIYETVKKLQIEGSFIAGHSLGGAIAMSFAVYYPDITKGVILIGTGAKLRVLPQILEGIVKEKEKTVKEILGLAFSAKAPKDLREKDFNETMQCSSEVIYKDFKACDNFNIMDSLDSINVPTLIICGTDDALTPPKYSSYLKEKIKDSRLVLIEDAGHMVMLEKPDEVNRAIEEFIKQKI